MKRLLLMAVVLTIASLASAQVRDDSFSAADVTVTEVVLTPRPDGGCAARWCAVVTSDDGGARLEACTDAAIELKATANQNRCAALASAGVNRVARQLRFDVAAGSP